MGKLWECCGCLNASVAIPQWGWRVFWAALCQRKGGLNCCLRSRQGGVLWSDGGLDPDLQVCLLLLTWCSAAWGCEGGVKNELQVTWWPQRPLQKRVG